MSRRLADKICNDPKQPKLAGFAIAKPEDTATASGMTNNRKICVHVLVNVITKVGKKDAKTMYSVSAVPNPQSSPFTTEAQAHATTSTAVCTGSSSTVNVTVTLTEESSN